MRVFTIVLLAATAALGLTSVTAKAAIDEKRVHVVEAHNIAGGGRNYFIRGNSPYNKDNKQIEYDVWVSAMAKAANSSGYVLPPSERLYIVDVSFENVFDKGFLAERKFFEDNPSKGRFLSWELLGAPLWPSSFTDEQVQEMIATMSVWKNDKLPERMVAFRSMLLNAQPPAGYDAVAYYVHCAAGCDRTGQFVAAYRITFDLNDPSTKPAIGDIFKKNCEECGRCPNYFSAGATGWYCMTVNYHNRTGLPKLNDCFTAFSCAPFGDCKATGV